LTPGDVRDPEVSNDYLLSAIGPSVSEIQSVELGRRLYGEKRESPFYTKRANVCVCVCVCVCVSEMYVTLAPSNLQLLLLDYGCLPYVVKQTYMYLTMR